MGEFHQQYQPQAQTAGVAGTASDDLEVVVWVESSDEGSRVLVAPRSDQESQHYDELYQQQQIPLDAEAILTTPAAEQELAKYLGAAGLDHKALAQQGSTIVVVPRRDYERWLAATAQAYKSRRGVAATPDPEDALWVSYSYGELPPQDVFMRQYRAQLGGSPYEMELVGDDAQAMLDAYGNPQSYTQDYGKAFYSFHEAELYMVIQSLMEQTENSYRDDMTEEEREANDAPMNLASGILYTLRIEWV